MAPYKAIARILKLDHSPHSKCNIYHCWQILIRIPKHFFRCAPWVCLVSGLSGPTLQCLCRAKRWLCAAAGMRCGNARAAGRGWTSQLRHRPPSELKLADNFADGAQTGRASPETGCCTIGPQTAYIYAWSSSKSNKNTDCCRCLDHKSMAKIMSPMQLLWQQILDFDQIQAWVGNKQTNFCKLYKIYI